MTKKSTIFTILILFSLLISVHARRPSNRYLKNKKRQMIKLFKRIGLNKPEMLNAFRVLDRTKFAYHRQKGKSSNASQAYADYPLAIGYGQTISSPRMMAIMTHYLKLKPNHKVLEIGTGSGYQAAVLSKIVKKVFTIEIVRPLGKDARRIFKQNGLYNIKNKIADGYYGWKQHAPFDRIMVTCATNHVPPSLIRQLKPGGIMLIPVGHPYRRQQLKIIKKTKSGRIRSRTLLRVKFVPMTGKALRSLRGR